MLPSKDSGSWLFGFILLIVLSIYSSTLLATESPSIRSDPEDFYPSEQSEDPRAILQDVPDFIVDSRTDEIDLFPCTDCHDPEVLTPNPKVRELEEMHVGTMLVHGNGRFWCLTCHSEKNRDFLISPKNKQIDFNDSYLLCGQCHYQRQKDFFYGAHGKRKGSWILERKLATCTECHNPHVPMISPRPPVAMPKIRKGLKPMKLHKEHQATIW